MLLANDSETLKIDNTFETLSVLFEKIVNEYQSPENQEASLEIKKNINSYNITHPTDSYTSLTDE